MHPEFSRQLASQRQAGLLRSAAGPGRPGPAHRRRTLGAGLLGAGPLSAAIRWLRRAGRPRLSGGAAAGVPQPAGAPGVFLAGPEAYGFRIYLTPAESSQLARDTLALLARFADRMDEPARRPAGAVPLEVVVLSRRLPGPAGCLPGPRA